jgi:hypothetical protein
MNPQSEPVFIINLNKELKLWALSTALVTNTVSSDTLSDESLIKHVAGRPAVAPETTVGPAPAFAGNHSVPTPSIFLDQLSPGPRKSSKEDTTVWHKRFMFANTDTLKHMLDNEIVTGFDINYVWNRPCQCPGCMLGKMHLLSWEGIPKHEQNACLPGEYCVVDSWGPANVATPGGCKMSYCITDVASRCSFGFLVKKKSDFGSHFLTWLKQNEVITGRKLKHVHFDLAGEFTDHAFRQILESNFGLKVSFATVRTKEQNAIAERKNRTHMDKAFAAMYDSSLPETLWGELFLAAIHVSNRTWSRSHIDTDKTPYELYNGFPADVRHLRRIGCIGYVFLEKEIRKKISPKAVICSLVGYSQISSCYRLVDIYTGRFYESRNVIFHEDLTAKDLRKQQKVLTAQDHAAAFEDFLSAVSKPDSLSRSEPAADHSPIIVSIDLMSKSDSLSRSEPAADHSPIIVSNDTFSGEITIEHVAGSSAVAPETTVGPAPAVAELPDSPLLPTALQQPVLHALAPILVDQHLPLGISAPPLHSSRRQPDLLQLALSTPMQRRVTFDANNTAPGNSISSLSTTPQVVFDSDSSDSEDLNADQADAILDRYLSPNLPIRSLSEVFNDPPSPTPHALDLILEDQDLPSGISAPPLNSSRRLNSKEQFFAQQASIIPLTDEPLQDLTENNNTYDIVDVELQSVDIRALNYIAPSGFCSPFVGPSDLIAKEPIPRNFKDILASKNRRFWLGAMIAEFGAHKTNNTFIEVVTKLAGYFALGTKWVFSTKTDIDGNIVRFKARLVLQGYRQRKGFDYNLTSSPVANSKSLRAILLLAAILDLEIHGMDVDTAFLNANLSEYVFVNFPEGYKPLNSESKYLRVAKALYGAKQAGREWYQTFVAYLLSQGYKQIDSDPCVLILSQPLPDGEHLSILFHVDDILLVGTPIPIAHFKSILKKKFKSKDLGDSDTFKKFTGYEIHRSRSNRSILLTQTEYTKEILTKFGYDNCIPASIPAKPGTDLSIRFLAPPSPAEISRCDSVVYSVRIGALLYLTNTRPDLYAALSPLCRYMRSPRDHHFQALDQIFRYLKHCLDIDQFGTVLGGNDSPSDPALLQIEAFGDADFANDVDTRRSRFGTILKWGGSTIGVSAGLHPTIDQSTSGAELRTQNESGKDVLWFRQFLTCLGFPPSTPTPMHCDNQASIAIIVNDSLAKLSRYLDIKLLWLRELFKTKQINPVYCRTSDMPADGLTKPLPRVPFQKFRSSIGVIPLSSLSSHGI